jgi:hypothetical protein
MVNLFMEVKQGSEILRHKEGFYFGENPAMGSARPPRQERPEARKKQFFRHVRAAEMRWCERVRWLEKGSKKHPALLTLARHNELTELMGSVHQPSGGDPDRPKKDWSGTKLGELIRQKVKGDSLAQNRMVRKYLWGLCGALSAVRLAHKEKESEEMIDDLLLEARGLLRRLVAELDKIK